MQKFEESEIKTHKDNVAMLKIQRQQSKREEDEDSEDDLNGWDFRWKKEEWNSIFHKIVYKIYLKKLSKG